MEKSISAEERKELADLLTSSTDTERKQMLSEFWEKETAGGESIYTDPSIPQHLDQILGNNNVRPGKVKVMPRRLLRVAVAAVFILLAGTAWFFLERRNRHTDDADQNIQVAQTKTTPATHGAILILEDGTQLVLDTVSAGVLSGVNNVKLIKSEAGLVYEQQAAVDVVSYNTMYTPRGRQYSLSLADGTKVWLNSATKLSFPAAFPESGNRVVELEGEAYFEVAENKRQPFIVQLTHSSGKKSEVKVLGTEFNILAYRDEPAIRATLLKGSIQFNTESGQAILRPGQHAKFSGSDDGEIIVEKANTEEATAWKNGLFHFSNADLETVMRQFSRWYDVDVVYADKMPPLRFRGKIQRDLNLEDVVAILQADVNTKIEGNRIIVSKK